MYVIYFIIIYNTLAYFTGCLRNIGDNMERLQIAGKWNQIKGRLKQDFSDLTENDLTYVEGKEDELLGRLQERLGRSKEELANMIRQYM